MDEANEFLFMGYDVMLVDFRGHGNSSGYRTTIGVKEAEDVKLAFDFIKNKGEKNIFLYGMSMGAVAITRAMHDYKLQPSGLILEAPFWSLQTYLKTRAGQLGFPSQPFAFFTSFWIGVENGFGGFKHKTARYVKSIDCPVLYQWGTLDDFVNESEIKSIYGATSSKNKKLAVYNGALHESLLRREPAKWRNETEQFLSANRK
jgi:alpha-beta hydrolase superfamily lysophospholipase